MIEIGAVLQDLDAIAGIDRAFGLPNERRHHPVDVGAIGEIETRFDAPAVRCPEQKPEDRDRRVLPAESKLAPGPCFHSPSSHAQ